MGRSTGSMLQFLLLVLIPLCHGEEAPAPEKIRLPDTLIPQRYELDITTHLEENNFSFDGRVTITIECIKETDTITLHLVDLTVLKVSLQQVINGKDTLDVPIKSHSPGNEFDFYFIKVDKLTAKNIYLLTISYSGVLQENLTGYYRSKYVDQEGKVHWLAVTQFGTIGARRAFPCLDEPHLKASFLISLLHKAHLTAISNMPIQLSAPTVIENEDEEEWVTDTFEETPAMSTYLVAFMVSEFEGGVADEKEFNKPFKVWARKEAIDQVELAIEIGPRALSFLSKFFEIDYVLPKMDMVAVPDFANGGMENFGMITLRENELLFNKKSSSIFNKKNIVNQIAQLSTHQWFGNLVTMASWTDIWVNVGFAVHLAVVCAEKMFPDWQILDERASRDFMSILSIDSLITSRPVSVTVNDPSEVDQMFDNIWYEKGPYLIKMANMFLGDDVFQKGATSYLKDNEYKVATADDVWASLTKAAQEDGVLQPDMTVKSIMDSWSKQSGFPLVTVTADYAKNTVTVTQERFLSELTPDPGHNTKEKACWLLPLTYTTSLEKNFDDVKVKNWLTCNGDGSVKLDINLKDNPWIIFNLRLSGLYRVNYNEENWEFLSKTLADEKLYDTIHPLNRAQIIIDIFGLAWIGKMKYEVACKRIQYLQHEVEFVPWNAATENLIQLDDLLMRTNIYENFKLFYRKLLEPTFQKLGNLGELPEDLKGIQFKTLIIKWACRMDMPNANEEMLKIFNTWQSEADPNAVNPIPIPLRGYVYCPAVKIGDERTWDFLWQRYENSNVETEKLLFLLILGCSRNKELLTRYLEWSIDPKKTRKQDGIVVFESVATENEIGYGLAKTFFMEKFQQIYEYYGSDGTKMGPYLVQVGKRIITTKELDKFTAFTTSVKDSLKGSELKLEEAIGLAKKNIAWQEKYLESLRSFLPKH